MLRENIPIFLNQNINLCLYFNICIYKKAYFSESTNRKKFKGKGVTSQKLMVKPTSGVIRYFFQSGQLFEAV